MGLLKSLNQDGHTIIMVTHNLEMGAFASRTIRVRDGKSYA
jgi:ABC-type lipoprotein export system ATPase subunit